MFNRYTEHKEHYSIVSNIFSSSNNNNNNYNNNFKWEIIERNNAASSFKTDFVLLSLSIPFSTSTASSKQKHQCIYDNRKGSYHPSCDSVFQSVINNIKEHSDVKYVFPEKRIKDSLKKWQEYEHDDEESESDYDNDNNIQFEGDDDIYLDIDDENDYNNNNNDIYNSNNIFNSKNELIKSSIINNNNKNIQFKFKPPTNRGRFHQHIPNMDDPSIKRIDSFEKRQLNLNTLQVTDMINARALWEHGFTGKGTKVAIFDTGLKKKHPHFKNVVEITNWTSESKEDDAIGHGTFVAGVIASNFQDCSGLAPDAELYIYRVFTTKKESFTSWFLDAFNHAIYKNIDVLNLSTGGPDFLDRPFVEKVNEMSSNNIIVVSAIGNDGPLYGTLNNPADQSDVIGVGGIDYNDNLASFSSRGMTTWEIPDGYGRIKPDLVAYGRNVVGTRPTEVCKEFSGTSVSSPVVAGAIALLISTVPENRRHLVNPASMKQVLIESAEKIPGANIFEQGYGKLNLLGAFKLLESYTSKVSLSPPALDFDTSNCSYMWPFCTQPLYFSGLPLVVNVTIINGLDANGKIHSAIWKPSANNGTHLSVSFNNYRKEISSWSGHLGVYLSVPESSKTFEGTAEGTIEIVVTVPPPLGSSIKRTQTLTLPVSVDIIPTPSREKRILWDQFHNLRYPGGFIPRDQLEFQDEPFDWNGDHIHTNFRKLYTNLRKNGYFIEVLDSPLTCYDPLNYGTLLIVDPEEEFFPAEIKKIEEDVRNKGLNLVVFADWYDTLIIDNLELKDPNSDDGKKWKPATGGSNVPALNDLLFPFGIFFGGPVYYGEITVDSNTAIFSSGTSIIGFPSGGHLLEHPLTEQTRLYTKGRTSKPKVPILGFYQTSSMENEEMSSSNDQSGESSSFSTSSSSPNPADIQTPAGKVVVFGDSNCLDESHQKSDCFWLLENIFEVLEHRKTVKQVFPEIEQIHTPLLPLSAKRNSLELPQRPSNGQELRKMSKVMSAESVTKCNPGYPDYLWSHMDRYVNTTWEHRDKVLPPIQIPRIPETESTTQMQSPFWIFSYVLICLVLIVIVFLFFKDKTMKRQLASSVVSINHSPSSSSSPTASLITTQPSIMQISSSNNNNNNNIGNNNGIITTSTLTPSSSSPNSPLITSSSSSSMMMLSPVKIPINRYNKDSV
eukprot:gene5432-6776_t